MTCGNLFYWWYITLLDNIKEIIYHQRHIVFLKGFVKFHVLPKRFKLHFHENIEKSSNNNVWNNYSPNLIEKIITLYKKSIANFRNYVKFTDSGYLNFFLFVGLLLYSFCADVPVNYYTLNQFWFLLYLIFCIFNLYGSVLTFSQIFIIFI